MGNENYRPGSKYRRRMAPPDTAESVLTKTLKKYRLDKDIARYQFVLKWREIVGDEIAKRTRPECIRGGALIVCVCDSVWAQELTFQKDVILKRLRQYVREDDVVRDIRFRVGNITSG